MQPPRIRHVPNFVRSEGADAIDVCAAVGVNLDPWQQHVLDGALGINDDGLWSAFRVGLLTPRQNGKSELAVARILAGLLLFEEELIIFSAHEARASKTIFNRVRRIIQDSPVLERRVAGVRLVNGEQEVRMTNGQCLQFMSRTTGAGRSFSADCVILDEAYALTGDHLAAIVPTLSARSNPQLWMLSSAGLEFSDQLKELRDDGIAGNDPNLAFFEWSSDPALDPEDTEAWRQANPAFGIRIAEKTIALEYRTLPLDKFKREILGHWQVGVSSPIPAESWSNCSDPQSRRGEDQTPTFALDVAPDRSTSAIGVAARRDDGLWHVEVVEHREGTDWILERLVEIHGKWKTPIQIDSAGAAASLLPDFELNGVEYTLLKSRDAANAAGGFLDLVVHDKLRHRHQDTLNIAVAGVTKRPLGDSFAWGRKTSTADISPLVAVTNAVHGAIVAESQPEQKLINNFW